MLLFEHAQLRLHGFKAGMTGMPVMNATEVARADGVLGDMLGKIITVLKGKRLVATCRILLERDQIDHPEPLPIISGQCLSISVLAGAVGIECRLRPRVL
ncbi:hypothetical protein LMG26686_03788 [Achromobacter mucicolens]|nr:hypothetical protein LMG26686_03788 [Achromobacter mucicolens]